MKQFSIILSLLTLLSACDGFFDMEKEINLSGPNSKSKIVVQGVIQPGYPAQVLLSRSEPYFSEVNGASYDNLFVREAQITVSDQYGQEKTLRSFSYILEENPLLALAGIDSSFLAMSEGFYVEWPFDIYNFNNLPYREVLAQPGERYDLHITVDGDTLTATTTIPNEHPVDSVWFVIDETAPRPNLGNFWFHYTDPDTLGNAIMFESKRLAHTKEQWIDSLSIVNVTSGLSDPIFAKALWGFVRSDFEGLNGTAFESLFQRGTVNSMLTDDWNGVIYEQEEFGYFKAGKSLSNHDKAVYPDTVLIRISQIDEAAFLFWRSIDYQGQSTGNPFAEPINLQSNIEGGYGVWFGQAASYYRAVAEEGRLFYHLEGNDLPTVDEIL